MISVCVCVLSGVLIDFDEKNVFKSNFRKVNFQKKKAKKKKKKKR